MSPEVQEWAVSGFGLEDQKITSKANSCNFLFPCMVPRTRNIATAGSPAIKAAFYFIFFKRARRIFLEAPPSEFCSHLKGLLYLREKLGDISESTIFAASPDLRVLLGSKQGRMGVERTGSDVYSR